jgi:hypothetical protein
MSTPWLFARAVAILVGLFGITIVTPLALSVWALERNLTEEARARGEAIADSIAAASADHLLFRDVATIQSLLDQYLEMPGVAYLFVEDAGGTIVSHTFVPGVPDELRDLGRDSSETTTRAVHIIGLGDILDSSSPILIGKLGYVHVGTNPGQIRRSLLSTALRQLTIMCLLFPPGALAAYWLMQTDQVRGKSV